jgi:hypothetical protein
MLLVLDRERVVEGMRPRRRERLRAPSHTPPDTERQRAHTCLHGELSQVCPIAG